MKSPRIALILLTLLVLVQVHSPSASMSILWRGAILSFDSPATQTFDELASGAAPAADPAREAQRSARVAATVSAPLAVRLVLAAARPAIDLARATRAPPAA